MKTKIEIDGVEYNLDVNRAKELKLLEEIPDYNYPLNVGDVYISGPEGNGTNPFRLVMAIWGNTYNEEANDPVKRYALLGIHFGCSANSDLFHQSLHNLEEIREFLFKSKMIYSHNTATSKCFNK